MSLVQGFQHDLRYSCRRIRSAPGFTLAVCLALALGVGANTAIFSVLDALLLRPLPVAHLDRLVGVCVASNGVPEPKLAVTAERLRRLQDYHLTLLEDVSGMRNVRVSAFSGDSRIVTAEAVFGNYFGTLGVTPKLGRFLVAADDAPEAEGTAVISEHLWRQWFQSDPEVLKRVLVIAGRPLTIIGVAPEGFKGLHGGNIVSNDIWFPSHFSETPVHDIWTIVFARLKPRATIRQADAELRVASALNPNDDGLTLLPLADTVFTGPPVFYAVAVAVLLLSGLVLFIACANLTNLLLARLTSRTSELALRVALGASRGRVIQLFTIEVGLLVAAGGALGLLLSTAITRLLALVQMPTTGGYFLHYQPSTDWRVFVYALSISIVAAWGITMAVASRALNVEALGSLSASRSAGAGATPRNSSARTKLIASQMACGAVLLISAGVTIRSTLAGLSWNPGFDTAHVAIGHLDYGWQGLKEPIARQTTREIARAFESVPGVVDVALVSDLPETRRAPFLQVLPNGDADDPSGKNAAAYVVSVTPKFFSTIGLRLLRGRDFTSVDDEGSEGVAIINESAARAVFGPRNPLGRHLEIRDSRDRQYKPEPSRMVRIIGVAADAETRSSYAQDRRVLYIPLEQRHAARLSLIVRGSPQLGRLVEMLKDRVKSATPHIALFDVRTMAEEVGGSFAVLRILAGLLAAVGVLGVLLAAVGLYGVVAYTVSQRTREFGVMKALGAKNTHIYMSIVCESCRMMVLGIVPGILLALLFVFFLQRMLPGIRTFDLPTLLVVPLGLWLIGLGASVLPLRRALRLEPYSALREL
jgi:predicted permease